MKIRFPNITSLFMLAFVLYSCKDKNDVGIESESEEVVMMEAPKSLAPSNYMEWVEDKNNGVKVEKTIGDFTFSALYKPYEYLALLELKRDSVTKADMDKHMAAYEGLQYYTFRISAANQNEELLKVNLKNPDDYYSRIEYFSFGMQKDLKLIDGRDTLDCAMFHFERVYGIAPYATFVLGFPLSEKKAALNDKTIFYDESMFGLGRIYMTIQSKNIKRIPELITQ